MCRKVRAIAFGVILAGVSCDTGPTVEQRNVAEVLRGLPPFDQITQVGLGQRASDLLESSDRQLDTLPYVGFGDTVPGYRIEYHVPGSVSDNQPPPATGQVRAVVAIASFETDSMLILEFRNSSQQAESRLGEAPCVTVRQGSYRAHVRRWLVSDGVELVIAMYPLQQLSEQWRPEQPRLQLHVGASGSVLPRVEAESTPCPP
jgi:hypothetical protein